MPSIQLSPLLRHLLNFLKRLRIVGDRLWKLGIRQILFLQNFVQKCISLIIGRFRKLNQISKSSGSHPFVPSDKENHLSHEAFENVDCFSRLPVSLFSRWQRSQSWPQLPLYHQEDYHRGPQTRPSTFQAVVSYSMTPLTREQMNISPLTSSSDTTRAQDDRNRDPPGLSSEISDFELVGVTSREFERYERNFTCEKIVYSSFPIPPFQMSFKERELPNQWVALNHPDGALFFFNDSRDIPIFTDVWLYEEEPNKNLEAIIKQIFSYIKTYKINVPQESCLVLEFRKTGRCGYYFVNHEKQCLFWLDEFNGMDFLSEVRVEYEPSLVGHKMKSLYWCHNHLFPIPDKRPLPSGAISEIKDILIHAIGDSLTSNKSLASFKLDVLQMMLDLVNKIQEQDKPEAGSIAIISRFLENFYHERFLHLYGQKIARLNRDQSIHPKRRRTWWLKWLISPVLLFGAEVHLKKLREITVDSLVNDSLWKEMLNQLTDEWKECTLYATVLLNANVAFLAIQSVDNGGSVGHRSNAQRASYTSVANSIAAIVLGLLLVRGHNTSLNSVDLLIRRLNRSATSMFGLETLALMYGLPYALLMWGMVGFLVAFSFTCYGSRDEITTIVLSICLLLLCLLLLWWTSVLYESQNSSRWVTFRRFMDSIKEWMIVRRRERNNDSVQRADTTTTLIPQRHQVHF